MNDLDKLIKKIELLLNDDKYKKDNELIKKLYKDLNEINKNLSNELIDSIDNNINLLDQKYDDLYDLVNIFDVLKYKYKKEIQKVYVDNLRKENRNKKLREERLKKIF
jgi:hypothetical protein